jgi:hypothetical protein
MQRPNAFPNILFIAVFSSLLAACGGGGGGGSSTPSTTAAPTVNQSAAGLWETTYQVTSGTNAGDTIQASALIVSAQPYHVANGDSVQCGERF